MAKSKGPEKKSDGAPDQEVSLKVYPAERDLILKVMGARGDKKVSELFASEVVREFLMHLMTEAVEEEKRRQSAKKKS